MNNISLNKDSYVSLVLKATPNNNCDKQKEQPVISNLLLHDDSTTLYDHPISYFLNNINPNMINLVILWRLLNKGENAVMRYGLLTVGLNDNNLSNDLKTLRRVC